MPKKTRKIQVDISLDIFNAAYRPYVQAEAYSTEIFFGGSSSGKSHFIAHRVVVDVLAGGHNYLIVRKVSNSLTKSVFNEIQKAIFNFKCEKLFDIVPSSHTITCVNGYQILFTGMDDPEKIKSVTPKKGVITDVWFEEATESAYEDIKQLRKRLRGTVEGHSDLIKRIILSFNPIYKTHWIYKAFFESAGWVDGQKKSTKNGILILKTTHEDNEHLTEQDHQALESETDPYWYEVYTRGNWGVLGDAIFRNWQTADLSGLISEHQRNMRYGLDFGYSSDPAAFVALSIDMAAKKIYIFRSFGATGLTNPALADILRRGYLPTGALLACDSSEPKSIQELRDAGLNAVGVKKGKNSVLFGIQWLQQFVIVVDESLQEIINELATYSWKKNRAGESLPIPEDRNNHYIDAIRYATETDQTGLLRDILLSDFPDDMLVEAANG